MFDKERVAFRSLSDTARSILREQLTFLPPSRLALLEGAVRTAIASGVQGDIVEFGLAWGGSAVVLAALSSPVHPYHGFDVFSMIPPPTDKDDAMSKCRYEVISSGQAKGRGKNEYYGYRSDLYADVCGLLAHYGTPVDGKRVHLHKGLFAETWPHYRGEQIVFAHVDCDWYDSVKFCLEAVADRLSINGCIIVDDYPEFGGCRDATHEFLKARRGEFSAQMRERLIIHRAR